MARELIYVSSGKLRQFAEAPRRRVNLGAVEGQVELPFVKGTLSLSPAQAGGEDLVRWLDRVVHDLGASGRSPHWFEYDQVRAGDWVEFVGMAAHGTIDARGLRVFVVLSTAESTQDTALFLYGSPGNAIPSTGSDTEIRLLDSRMSSLAQLIRTLEEDSSPEPAVSWLRDGMTGIIDQVRREFLAQAQVRTWAKVVAVVPTDEHLLIHPSGYSGNQTTRIARPDRLLLGTPLFVEYTE